MNHLNKSKLINIPILKSLVTPYLLAPENIISYEPMLLNKSYINKKELALVILAEMDSLLNLSLAAPIDKIMIRIITNFINGDELLIVTKAGSTVIGKGFLKDNKSLLLTDKTEMIGKTLKISEIKFLGLVSDSIAQMNEIKKEA
ncbi:hypothetical protein [Priestia flexa]|uniref:Uncharacterized protein n=1 Tax=Priestia flexa TaxID=86664 RepID=A0ABU4J4G8_9BACI|nr:hypothetical protein [Priestia flexa]MDW8515858.1 hypothetical protein [Priestia flexa]